MMWVGLPSGELALQQPNRFVPVAVWRLRETEEGEGRLHILLEEKTP